MIKKLIERLFQREYKAWMARQESHLAQLRVLKKAQEELCAQMGKDLKVMEDRQLALIAAERDAYPTSRQELNGHA